MTRDLNTIKAVVIALGVGIIGLTILIVMVIIDKVGDAALEGETTTQSAATFADVAVALPAGAEVMTMTGDGDAISLLIRLGDDSQQIITIDRRTGEVLGTLELLPRNP